MAYRRSEGDYETGCLKNCMNVCIHWVFMVTVQISRTVAVYNILIFQFLIYAERHTIMV